MERGRGAARRHARVRTAVSGVIGLGVALVVLRGLGSSAYALSLGWSAAGAVFLARTWWVIALMGPDDTASHAAGEEPGGTVLTELIILLACVASLGALVYLLLDGTASDRLARAMVGVVTVVVSWIMVHTIYTLRYARAYYSGEVGGIEFAGEGPPQYSDFAYLGFTLGMTYQVSDTNLSTRAMRSTALQHCLLSYVFGTVVLASAVNAVIGLAGAHG
jgi:uncharacterized membrane protein